MLLKANLKQVWKNEKFWQEAYRVNYFTVMSDNLFFFSEINHDLITFHCMHLILN